MSDHVPDQSSNGSSNSNGPNDFGLSGIGDDSPLSPNHIPNGPVVRRDLPPPRQVRVTLDKARSRLEEVRQSRRNRHRHATERALAAFVYGQWEQEFAPTGAFETAAVLGAAENEARRRIIHHAIMEKAKANAPHHREFRRQPFLDAIENLQQSLRIWISVRDDGFELGDALQRDFAALLRDLDPNATPKKFGSVREVTEFVFRHNKAIADARYKELYKKYANRKRIGEADLDGQEYLRRRERLEKATDSLKEWVVQHIDRLIAKLSKVERALADDDAQPDRPFAWQAETEEGRKMVAIHDKAEAAIRRSMRTFDDHRRRVMRAELRRDQLYRQVGADTMYVGDLQVKMPSRYAGMMPRLKIETMIDEFRGQLRYYPDRDVTADDLVRDLKEDVADEEFTYWLEDVAEAEFRRLEELERLQRRPESEPDDQPPG